MIKKILLIDVDLPASGGKEGAIFYTHHPIGLLYLVSAVRESFPEIDFKVFHTATHTQPLEEIKNILHSFEPDLVGLRSLSIAKAHFMEVAAFIKEINPGLPVVGGGPYPSVSYAELLNGGLIDMAVIGEGEATFTEVVREVSAKGMLPQGIDGTAVLKNRQILLNPARRLVEDVDRIPFPDYSRIHIGDYAGIENHALQKSSECAFILSSRGCPYACFYCHQLFGRRIRRRSAANVVAEMRAHLDMRGIDNFVFLDDVFNLPALEAKTLLRLIAKELPGVKLNFPNGLRADRLDEEIIDLFSAAGTVEMALAVETATPRLQKLIGKNLDIVKAAKAIDAVTRRFITRLFFIVGFPDETYEEAMETIRFAAGFKYAAQPMLSVLRIYENSPFYIQLNPDAAQAKAIAEQEKKQLHLEMFDEIHFYGDFFPADKVPLKSADLKELLYIWMRDVLIDTDRIKKSHGVLLKHLDDEKIIEFYRNVFNKPGFGKKDLEKLLR